METPIFRLYESIPMLSFLQFCHYLPISIFSKNQFYSIHFLCFISNAVLQRPVDTSKIFQGVAQALLIFPAKFPTVVANFKIEDHHCLFKKCVIWSKTLFFLISTSIIIISFNIFPKTQNFSALLTFFQKLLREMNLTGFTLLT